MDSPPDDAIVLENVAKRFRKRPVARDYTTLKTELVNILRGRFRKRTAGHIEALNGVNLRVRRGSTIGIIGRNGSGKSTLLKLMTGIYRPTSGSVHVHGRISALLELGAGFHPDFTGRENVLINAVILGMSRAEAAARLPSIIEFSELGDFIEQPVRTYSSGMYMRLAFSVATHVDPDVLIVDEILAVGDDHFARKSLAKMTEFKQRGKTIVLVTHDLGSVQRWCDVAAWLDGGKIRLLGNPAEVVGEYQRAVREAEARSANHAMQIPSGGPATPPPQPAPDQAQEQAPAQGQQPPASAPAPDQAQAQAQAPAQGQQAPASAPDTGLPPEDSASEKESYAELRPVVITAVRVLRRGVECLVFDIDDPAEIRVEYKVRGRVEKPVSFSVRLHAWDGRLIYGTSTEADRLTVPHPLPPQGSFSLEFDRLGLLEGEYGVAACLHDPEGTTLDQEDARLSVADSGGDAGFVRLPHRWVLPAEEGKQAEQPAAGLRTPAARG